MKGLSWMLAKTPNHFVIFLTSEDQRSSGMLTGVGSPGNQPSAPTLNPPLHPSTQLSSTVFHVIAGSSDSSSCHRPADELLVLRVHGTTKNHGFLRFQGSSWAACWGRKAVWTSCRVTGMLVSFWVPASWPVTTPGSSTPQRNSLNLKPPSGETTCRQTHRSFTCRILMRFWMQSKCLKRITQEFMRY